ncbi:MAG TPA: hypothetical protein VH040_14900 [Usitatibacter sp.]|nr:hypothetical protein [Usitatibacter sp.]
MADQPTIFGIVGAITGGIGAVCGIAAIVVSTMSYRRVSEMKSLDLRLELRKVLKEIDADEGALHGLLEHAHESHVRVLNATGRNRSGEEQAFEEAFQSDKGSLASMAASRPRVNENGLNRYSSVELERYIADLHGYGLSLARLSEKYQSILASDDERRRDLRREVEVRVPK